MDTRNINGDLYIECAMQDIGRCLIDHFHSDASKTSATSSNPTSLGVTSRASLQGRSRADLEAVSNRTDPLQASAPPISGNSQQHV